MTLDISDNSHTEWRTHLTWFSIMGTHRYAVHPIDVFPTKIKQIWANESPFPIDFVHHFKDTLSSDLMIFHW